MSILTNCQKAEIVAALQELLSFAKIYRQDPQNPELPRFNNGIDFQPEVGLCNNLYQCLFNSPLVEFFEDGMPDFLSDITAKWPKYSGHAGYPVPDPENIISGYVAYYDYWDKWLGPYGDLRMELLDFLILKVEQMINEGE